MENIPCVLILHLKAQHERKKIERKLNTVIFSMNPKAGCLKEGRTKKAFFSERGNNSEYPGACRESELFSGFPQTKHDIEKSKELGAGQQR